MDIFHMEYLAWNIMLLVVLFLLVLSERVRPRMFSVGGFVQ